MGGGGVDGYLLQLSETWVSGAGGSHVLTIQHQSVWPGMTWMAANDRPEF